MRRAAVLLLALLLYSTARAEEPKIVAKPDAFPTLVNPNCSHCIDEAKRRGGELRDDDPVLCWTRGYSDGGAIPLRFFFGKHRVISDSYGVFVYDPDAGFARGFAPSYNFVFHGWRNGIMVIKDAKDGTLYSALSGIAFDGPRKGERLKSVPTLTTTWGAWVKVYPNAVTYQMFDKYKPVELPKEPNAESVKTRPAKADPRLKPDELVLGVRVGQSTKAYPLAGGTHLVADEIAGEKVVIFHWGKPTTVAAYRPIASQPRKFKAPNPDKDGVSPADPGKPLSEGSPEVAPKSLTLKKSNFPIVFDVETESVWNTAGRAIEGKLAGWALEPVDSVVCKWFAWSAEYPETEVFGQPKPAPKKDDAIKEVAGAAEFLRLLPKPFATLRAVDVKARTVTLLMDGETVAKVWSVETDAEVKIMGWWGRLEQLKVGDRVWVWLKLNRNKQPVSVCMIADEPSEQDIHGDGLTIDKEVEKSITLKAKKQPDRTLGIEKAKFDLDYKFVGKSALVPGEKLFVQSAGKEARALYGPTAFERARGLQKDYLRGLWGKDGLPATVSVQHTFSGELEVLIDHEGQRWARSLGRGDTIHIQAEPPIKAVVKAVSPWRERTQLRLVVGELAAADLKPGERVNVKMTPPKDDVLSAAYPPDIDRPRTRDERVEWFLASIYCTCKVRGDICTGHFYTLASCNPNGCATPNETRKQVRELIDKGMSDRQVWDSLAKEKGPLLGKPHLLP